MVFSTVLVCAVLLLAGSVTAAHAADVDEDCVSKLTRTDPHMSAFVGQVLRTRGEHPEANVNTTYEYIVGVCVPPDQARPDCAAMQYDESKREDSHCLGKLASTQVARSKDGVWIELTYTSGDNFNHHCDQQPRVARIAFMCDPYIPKLGSLDFLEENNQDDLCYYLFGIASQGVCGPLPFSPGDIICIIVAALIILWLLVMVGGVLFKRFMMGAKGKEQIPLLDLYQEFGNLEADGCDFVCRTSKKKEVAYKEPSFGADTDEEDEKDDNLLPM